MTSMNCDKIVAINDSIVSINSSFTRSDNSTCISLRFYAIDTLESGISVSGLPVTCNIARRRAVVYGCYEVVDNKTGLYRQFLLCWQNPLRGCASETTTLWLYTVDNRDVTFFGEFRLPVALPKCPSDFKLDVVDGPTICFVVRSDVYVATSDGTVQMYPTGTDGVFQHMTSWVEDEHLLVVGLCTRGEPNSNEDLSVNQPAVLSVCINTSKQLYGFSCEALVPDVYLGTSYIHTSIPRLIQTKVHR